ncbi:hypothetical protein KY284_002904 [Solanum tuberosum]|nr:hypothetical protein KY284_002904 [Solanum tuberosum]
MGSERQQTSSSIVSPSIYHVFLSFRGEDTRKTFTDTLYAALVGAGWRTFKDDNEIERGENIKTELENAIINSRSSIIILSKNYSTSTWCLDELVKILEHKRTKGHAILPVFYHVDPSEVRDQKKSFAEAFTRYERQIEAESDEGKREWMDKVQKWRAALGQVADLGGVLVNNQEDRKESEFIEEILQLIEDKLNRTISSVAPYLVGISSRVKNIISWLQDGSYDDNVIAICGMSGIGKTTVAKYVFTTNFRRFEGSSFLANIQDISQQPDGLIRLQKQLLYDLTGKKSKIQDTDEGIIKIRDAICFKRVLVILDDIDQQEQIHAIIGMKNWFCPGSKIIITTKNSCLLKVQEIQKVHKVREMGNDESLELFSWHSFGEDHPADDYMELSKRVVKHCGGLPLALQVLGSSLRGKNIDVWKSALDKLEAIPASQDKDYVIAVLDESYIYTRVGIQNLTDRFLLMIEDLPRVHSLGLGYCTSLERVTYLSVGCQAKVHHLNGCKELTDMEGSFKLETMGGIEKTMKLLELSMWDSVRSFEVKLRNNLTHTESRGPVKVFFERGLISIYLPGSKVPDWFCYKSAGATLSFTVPSPPDLKIQGITVCSVYTIDWKVWVEGIQFYLVIHNEQKNVKLIYSPTCYGLPEAQSEMLWFTHWIFLSQLDAGDTLNVSVVTMEGFSIKEIGIHLMHGEQVDMVLNSNSQEMQRDYPYQGMMPTKRQGLVDLYCYGHMGIGLDFILPYIP